MIRITFFSLMLGLMSCQANQKPKVVNYETIKPKMQKHETSIDSTTASSQLNLDPFNRDSVGLEVTEGTRYDTLHFLDRFAEHAKHTHLQLSSLQGSFRMSRWQFSDSIERKNALFNWLDHFGKNNRTITWLKPTILSSEFQLILINTRSIIEVTSSNNVSVRSWLNYQRFNYPKDSTRYIVQQKSNHVCRWFKVLNFKILQECPH